MIKIFVFCLVFCAGIEACTAFQLKSQDGAIVYGRSLEFGFPLNSDLLIVPRGTSFTGTGFGSKPGLTWSAKYGYVGMNQSFYSKNVSDGMNEKGLVVGCLYLPGYAQYQSPDHAKMDKTLGAWELTSYLLGTCATLDDVKTALDNVLVAQEPIPLMQNFILPLHFYISDQSGIAVVIEYVGGEKHVYDNPLGVLTNSPPFDWQLVNLGTYINLSPINVPTMQLSNFTVRNYGQGSGTLGIPGDCTPPSRFVRAALYSQWATPAATAVDAVCLAFHILNTFDIFEGVARDAVPKVSPLGTAGYDKTEWVIVHDKTNLKTYFRTYTGQKIQMVDLTKLDFTKPGFKVIPLKKIFEVDDSTANIRALK